LVTAALRRTPIMEALTGGVADTLTGHALAYLYAHSFMIATPARDPGVMMHAPFALLPRKVSGLNA
jgi:hypothetical protein